MDKMISVIVPVYKTEDYLKRCVDSILASTHENIEVILVDDGSPDNSGKICDEYAEKDARVKAIHKKNGGLSSARNAGLDAATGEYITFVDSDDYIADDIYEKLVIRLEAKDADIAMMGVMPVSEDCIEISGAATSYAKYPDTISGEELFSKICERELETSVWSKLFVAKLFESVRFDEKKLNEDFLLLSEMLIGNNVTVALVDAIGYYYYTRTGSITKSGFGKSLYDAVYNTCDAKERADRLCPELVSVIGAYAAYQARTAVLVMTREQFRENYEFREYCREVIKANKKYIKNSFMNKKERTFCAMYIKMPRFTKWIFDLLRRGRR